MPVLKTKTFAIVEVRMKIIKDMAAQRPAQMEEEDPTAPMFMSSKIRALGQ